MICKYIKENSRLEVSRSNSSTWYLLFSLSDTHTNTQTHIHTYVLYIYIYIYIYIHIYICFKNSRLFYTHIYVCVCVSLSLSLYIYIYIYIYHHHHHHHVVPLARISLTLSRHFPYHSSPLAGLQGYIPYPHIAAECMFVLVVLFLPGHM